MSDKKPEMTEREIRWLVRCMWMFLIVSVATTVIFGLHSVYLHFHPEAPVVKAKRLFKDPSKVTKHIRVNGVDYDIPVSYFFYELPYYEQKADIILAFMWPSMQPLEDDPNKLHYAGRQNEWMRVLSKDKRYILDIQALGEAQLRSTNKKIISGHQYGLEVYNPEGQRGEGPKVPYLYREDGKIKTVIACNESDEDFYPQSSSKPSYKRNPQCSHFFSDGYLMHDISYAKIYLPEWKVIQSKVENLYVGFRDEALQKGLSEQTISSEKIDPYLHRVSPVKKEN